MHYSSKVKMIQFIDKYDVHKRGGTVVDIGSMDINGTYRELFPYNDYIGVDIVAGPNVDIIMGSPEWDALENIDIVISGQVLEHVKDIPKLMASIYKIVAPGGLICMIAPSAGPEHEPPWYGNISKERMIEVVEGAGFEVLSCTILPIGIWQDNCCIATKPKKEKNAAKSNEL
jgi:SAM-dependent methyltransferase